MRYVVQPGETLHFIARRHGITLRRLLELNPHIKDPDRILPGLVIFLP